MKWRFVPLFLEHIMHYSCFFAGIRQNFVSEHTVSLLLSMCADFVNDDGSEFYLVLLSVSISASTVD